MENYKKIKKLLTEVFALIDKENEKKSEEKKFRITYECVTDVSIKDLWPDGDAPKNPTLEEAYEVAIDEYKSVDEDNSTFVDMWNLDDNRIVTTITISEIEAGSKIMVIGG